MENSKSKRWTQTKPAVQLWPKLRSRNQRFIVNVSEHEASQIQESISLLFSQQEERESEPL